MGKLHTVKQLPCNAKCGWCHQEGKDYGNHEIYPNAVCPILYHSIYPYFLGLLYNADMQDIWVCCPAEKGVDVLVRKESNTVDNIGIRFIGVPAIYWVIYAEIVNEPECPHGHYKGQKILFPTAFKKNYLCPAGVNNIFPFLDIEVPKCINKKKLRCPDWKDTVPYALE